MTGELFTALISLIGTLVGTLSGILASNKLMTYRIKKLEEKQDKHNSIIERTYVLEGQVKELQHEVIELKREV